MSANGTPSATSLIVKSNSLRATKSMAFDARSDPSASTATFAPIMPIFSAGFASLNSSAVRTSCRNDGVDVCSTIEVALEGLAADVVEGEVVRRRVDQLRSVDERRRLREPRRVPERRTSRFIW